MMALRIKGLRKRYGDFEALKGLDLEVREGEILALLGPNGAGKTTLIRILAEGLAYNTGEVRVFGKSLSRETRRLIGYIPQESIAYDLLTVRENLEFYADLYNASRERIGELIELFSLPERKKAKELSGGFKRRLNLAIALLYEPELLILDEPTTGLDVPSRREFWEIIRRFRDEGKTVLLATHYMEEAEELAERVAVMNEGKVIATETPDELKRLIGEESIITIRGLLKGLGGIGYPFVEKGDEVRVRVRNPREALPEIVEILVKAGSRVKEIKVEEPTLEDVFIKLTGRGLE
ncbi:ABC transporter ATP-binding protein [Palaeococcus ferrophilus]|uniref:ABC transporter ATP-binding protein n=1 Tax=Palaeococcus ferrophilus TaxID=83868 RepID=UPI000A95C54C|nr:ABC transporter ATP-binding protein [Palaeococcus ferrophilus]